MLTAPAGDPPLRKSDVTVTQVLWPFPPHWVPWVPILGPGRGGSRVPWIPILGPGRGGSRVLRVPILGPGIHDRQPEYFQSMAARLSIPLQVEQSERSEYHAQIFVLVSSFPIRDNSVYHKVISE